MLPAVMYQAQPATKSDAAPASRRCGAFGLLEFVGVLAIIAILMALAFPVVVRRVDIAAVNAETTDLKNLNDALVLQILRSNSIPSEATWAQAAGNWLAYAPATITTNARRYARALLIDTNGWLGANLKTNGYYVQTNVGTIITNSARMMIVSSLSAALPVATGRPGSASFNDIWNTAPNAIPSTWTTWQGRGDDLLIQRINLQPLFYQLILVNRDNNNAATYSIVGPTNLVMARSISNAFYFSGSVVRLGSTNSGVANLQTSYVLDRNNSFVFENGYWRTQIGNGPTNNLAPNPGSSFNNFAQAFIHTADNPASANNSGKGGAPEQVLVDMLNFMMIYQLWANNPHGSFTTYNLSAAAKANDSMYFYLKNARTRLAWEASKDKQSGQYPNSVFAGLLQ